MAFRQYIHLDFETYSEADLTKVGALNYALHPSTRVLCMSYRIGDSGPVMRWRPGQPYPFSNIKKEIIIKAFNSSFERIIWNYVCTDLYGWPELKLEQFYCVSALARTQAAPSKLENVALMLDLKFKKDMKGHRLMLKMCRPAPDRDQLNFLRDYDADIPEKPVDVKQALKESIQRLHDNLTIEYSGPHAEELENILDAAKTCHHTPSNMRLLERYCDADVLTECAIEAALDPWTRQSLRGFLESERINDRGWCVSKRFAESTLNFIEHEKKYFEQRLKELTEGVIRTPKQYVAIKEWLLPQVSDDVLELMKTYDKGELKYTLDADTRSNILMEYDQNPDFLTPSLAEFIDVIDQAGKSTIAKYEAIARKAVYGETSDDWRVHALYKFAGAAQTGRFSSVGLQVHNLNRDVPSDALKIMKEVVLNDLESLDRRENAPKTEKSFTTGPAIHLLARVIRPTFKAPKHKKLIWGDWSAIEARMLPWLSGDLRAESVLDIFRKDKDIYLNQAEKILGLTSGSMCKDDPRRQAYGKVPVLSLGYGGSLGAFKAMGKAYGVVLDDSEIRHIVKEWRADNDWAPDFWYALEDAAISAIEAPGCTFKAGRVSYIYDPARMNGIGALMCFLPSGRKLYYPGAQVELSKKPWGDISPGITAFKAAWSPKAGTSDWPRMSAWYGLLAENITQAACADLIIHCLDECRLEELEICAHTHDELIAETVDPYNDALLLKDIMENGPDYFKGLPLKADIDWGYHYKVKEGSL